MKPDSKQRVSEVQATDANPHGVDRERPKYAGGADELLTTFEAMRPYPYNPSRVTRFTPPYRQAPSRPGVYLFLALGSGLVKIGYTECVSQRIQGGMTGPGGESLGYLATLHGGPRVEKFWHRVYSHRRAPVPNQREWFYLCDGMFTLIHEARRNPEMTREWCADELAMDEEHYQPLVDYNRRTQR